MSKMKKLHCQYCEKEAERVSGLIIYPHRPDLKDLTFYQCKPCNSYVGTHKGTNKPLGTLANKELRSCRSNVHSQFDLIWKNGILKRKSAYSELSNYMQIPFKDCHIALFNIEQCDQALEYVNERTK